METMTEARIAQELDRAAEDIWAARYLADAYVVQAFRDAAIAERGAE